MLRLICGKTLKDKITNEKVRELTGEDEMKEFMRGQRLRWLGHVERMNEQRTSKDPAFSNGWLKQGKT